MLAQYSIIGIKIDGFENFDGGVMKSARKMRLILERSDIFGRNPKLYFDLGWLAHHYALPVNK